MGGGPGDRVARLLGVGGFQWGALSFGACVTLSCWAGRRLLGGEALLSRCTLCPEAEGSRRCLCDRAMLTLQVDHGPAGAPPPCGGAGTKPWRHNSWGRPENPAASSISVLSFSPASPEAVPQPPVVRME